MRPVSSWGRLTADAQEVVELADRARLAEELARRGPGIAYGLGRSYGDACLNPGGVLWSTTRLDRFISFDPESGLLDCEAGAVLRDIQHWALQRGWSLPVLPGTQFVTVGGAIANDVHGKNHHGRGTFGDNVESLQLLRCDGELIDCGPQANTDWFQATVAGLGLTGLIVRATLRLQPSPGPWLLAETIAYAGLDEFLALADESDGSWEHTVSWIDCTSVHHRGLFMRANPTEAGRSIRNGRQLAVPLTPPLSLINGLTLRPFNELYYRLGRSRAGRRLVHYEPFLFPLDSVSQWNRMYGPKGFFQYQCVVPREATGALLRMLAEISRSGEGSMLAVLKTFGSRRPAGLLSFARPGVTLALDFPNRGPSTLALFERLDAILLEAGGRLYLAKDARMPRALFERTYPVLGDFVRYRDAGMSSAMSRRLMGS